MIRKIICPTDFSLTAINAEEYAANLAKSFGAELLFVNVQKVMLASAAVSLGEGIGRETMDSAHQAVERLKERCSEAKKMFDIEAKYEVDVTAKSLSATLSSLDSQEALIVMGTNGVDNMYKLFFGTQTYQLITKAKCPVIVVPQRAAYEGIRKIVFAWDYSSKTEISFSLLGDFKKTFDPSFIFLHASTHHTGISHDLFSALREEIETVLEKKSKVEFKQQFVEDIPKAIDKYMVDSKADLLCITYYNRGMIRDMFHGTVARELSEMAEYPILVLHA